MLFPHAVLVPKQYEESQWPICKARSNFWRNNTVWPTSTLDLRLTAYTRQGLAQSFHRIDDFFSRSKYKYCKHFRGILGNERIDSPRLLTPFCPERGPRNWALSEETNKKCCSFQQEAAKCSYFFLLVIVKLILLLVQTCYTFVKSEDVSCLVRD